MKNRYIVEYELELKIAECGEECDLGEMVFCEIEADDEYEALRIARKMNPKLKIYQIFLNRCFPNKWNCMRCRYE